MDVQIAGLKSESTLVEPFVAAPGFAVKEKIISYMISYLIPEKKLGGGGGVVQAVRKNRQLVSTTEKVKL